MITNVQLKDENHDKWSDATETVLQAKRKLGFVDGSIPQPKDDDPMLEEWRYMNPMIVACIRNTIEPTLRSFVSQTKIAKELWDDLKQRFSDSNDMRIHEL